MPWLKTKEIIPPLNKPVTLFEDGKKVVRELAAEEVYNGKGSLSDKAPEFWAPASSIDFLPNPVSADDGWGKKHVTVQDEKVQPKLVDGEAPPSKQSYGPDGYVGS